MFVNGMIVGCAEVISNFASGVLLLKVKEDLALKIFCCVGIVSNSLLLFVTNSTSSYIALFFAMGGTGGMYNSLMVVIEMQVSPVSFATVMQLILTIGAIGNSVVSIMSEAPQPWPIVMTIVLCSCCLGLSFLLPEGGKFLQKIVKVSDSVTIMDVMPLQQTIHDTILLLSDTHTLS